MPDAPALLGAVHPNRFCRSSDLPGVHAFPEKRFQWLRNGSAHLI